MTNYIEIIGTNFPNVRCHAQGDTYTYEDIIYDGGDPLPSKEVLDGLYTTYCQEVMWTKIKEYRDMREESGVQVSIGGNLYWFHSDVKSLIKYLFLMILSTVLSNVFANYFPNGITWKTMDEVEVPLTPGDIIAIFFKVMEIGSTVFAIAKLHRVAMNASPTPLTYNYKTGGNGIPAWPPIYGE